MMANVGITCCILSIAIVFSNISRAAGVTSLSVVISPKHVHFMVYGFVKEKNITCKATSHINITMCEFRVFDLTDERNIQQEVYAGDGLTSGEFVTTLKASELVVGHEYIATCRVRSPNHDWVYASMSVYKSYMSSVSLESSAYDLVVLPGTKLNLLVRGESTLAKCSIKPPGSAWRYPFFSQGYTCVPDYYYGDGQAPCSKTCGTSFDKVTEKHNGIFLFILESSYCKDTTFINVVVAKLPSTLTLNHEMLDNADGSVTLKATCTVRGSRPAPLVTWLLDGDVVPDEAVRSVAAVDWVWPYEEQTVKQIMTLNLNESHAGKEVWCSAVHPTFNITLYNTFKIRSGLVGATVQPESTLTSSQMFTGDINAATPTAALSTSSNQGAASDPASVSEKLGGVSKCEVTARGVKWLYLVIGVLASLLVLWIICVLVYARRKKLCFFSESKEKTGESVEYRRSLDASFKYEETRSPTASTMDRSSVVTGLEYAEIRVSMVQRCVDKLQGNTNSLTPSAEAGEQFDCVVRPNSLYLTYDEEV